MKVVAYQRLARSHLSFGFLPACIKEELLQPDTGAFP